MGIEVDLSVASSRVIQSLERVIEWRGMPATILCDSSPEYISGTLIKWAAKHKIQLDYIQPGKPQQKAYLEH